MSKPAFLSLLILLAAAQLAGAQIPQRKLCPLFTSAEVSKLLGTAVEGGEPAAMGTGCQWFGKDEVSYAIIQVQDSAYWLDPRQAPGYQTIVGLGARAYAHADAEGGWRAMVLTGKGVALVVLIGTTAKRENAVELLKQLVERM